MSSPISGFTAVPNPYMIPLLFLQSLLIGAGFGIGYQGERRKLSAMSNEKFNELDLGLHAFDQFKEILARNDFGKMLDLMHPLTKQLAESFGELINNLPDIFSGFAEGVQGKSQQGGASFTGGLPNVDSGIGDFFHSLAEQIRRGFNFTEGGNPAADFQAILKRERAKNALLEKNKPNTDRLRRQVQQVKIDTFQEKLKSESAAKKELRRQIEVHSQALVRWLQFLKKLGNNPSQTNKAQYRMFLTGHALSVTKANQFSRVFNAKYKNDKGFVAFPVNRKHYKR